jgi:hypothetical protein
VSYRHLFSYKKLKQKSFPSYIGRYSLVQQQLSSILKLHSAVLWQWSGCYLPVSHLWVPGTLPRFIVLSVTVKLALRTVPFTTGLLHFFQATNISPTRCFLSPFSRKTDTRRNRVAVQRNTSTRKISPYSWLTFSELLTNISDTDMTFSESLKDCKKER